MKLERLKLYLSFILWAIIWAIIFEFSKSYVKVVQNPQHINMDIKTTLNKVLKDVKNSIKSVQDWVSTPLKYQKFEKIKQILERQYIDPKELSGDKMMENALKWFVDAIWDPFTVYLSPEDNKSFEEELKWSNDFEWIWAIVTKKENWVMIEQLIKDGPAFRAWLQPLDVIIKANDVELRDLPLWEAVSHIKWPAWTKVKLLIIRDWQLIEKTVVREKIEIHSVLGNVIQLTWNINVWYINISIFGDDTVTSLKNVISDLKKQDIKWIILDIRWNWWGYLPVAVDVASFWIPHWKVIVKTKYRDVYNNKELLSKWYWQLEWLPTVILVDGLTASASEIISAAIRYRTGAKLVWTRTFGKWTIQTMKEFDDGSSLKYTIWKWYTPNDKNIHKKWLLPDIEVKFDKDKYKNWYDNQLEKWKQVLLEMVKK